MKYLLLIFGLALVSTGSITIANAEREAQQRPCKDAIAAARKAYTRSVGRPFYRHPLADQDAVDLALLEALEACSR